MTNINDNDKLLNQIEQEIDRIQIIIQDLSSKIKDYSDKEIKDLKKELQDKKDEKAQIEASNSDFYNQIRAWENAPGGAGKPSEIFVISKPSLRLNYFMLNTLIKQFNVFFARFDNPFEACDNYTDAEKRVLLENIIPDNYIAPGAKLAGSARVPIDSNNTKVVNKNITDWEKWEPGKKGATEPTYRSWEWFKRWWTFHRQYPREELMFGTSASDFNDYPVLFEKREGMATLGGQPTPYRNVIAYGNKIGKDKLYSTEFDSKLNSSSSLLLIQCYYPKVNIITDPSIEYDTYYAGDFISFFLDEVFRKDKIGSNLILKPSTTGKNYQVEPKNWREDNTVNFLNTGYYSLKSGVSNSYSYTDHELKGQPISSFVASNYVTVDSNIHRFSFKGLSGLADLASDIFSSGAGSSDGAVAPKTEFYKREVRISLFHSNIANGEEGLSTNPPEPDFFKDKNIDASPKSKLPDLKDTKDVDEKIKELEEKIDNVEGIHNLNAEERKQLIAKRRERQNRLIELIKEKDKLTGNNESTLLANVRRTSRAIYNRKAPKFYYEQITSFRENFEKLNSVVLSRLANQNKWFKEINGVITEWDWKDEFKKGGTQDKEKRLETPFAISEAVDSECRNNKMNDDPTLKFKDELMAAWDHFYKKGETDETKNGVMTRAERPNGVITKHITSKLAGRTIGKYLDEWLKDKSSSNRNAVNETTKALKELSKLVNLSTELEDALKRLEDSDLGSRDLEEYLKEILGNRQRSSEGRACIARWKKSKYADGTLFYDLMTNPSDLVKDEKFHEWLESNDGINAGSGNIKGKFAEWFMKLEDINADFIGPLCEYRIKIYVMETNSTDRAKIPREKVLNWFNEAHEYGRSGSFRDEIKDGSGKTADTYWKELREEIAKGPGKALGLELSNTTELNKATEWGNFKEYSTESKISALVNEIDEEFLKAQNKKDRKEYILVKTPQEVVKEVRSYQIEKSGITAETVPNIKKGDTAQIEKAESVWDWIDELENLNLATAEHIKLKAAISKQKSVWSTTLNGEKPEDKKPETDGDKKPETDGDKKPEGETTTTKPPTDEPTKWYKKVWPWLLIIGALALIGFAIWYFMSGKNKEGGEEEEGEPETTPQP